MLCHLFNDTESIQDTLEPTKSVLIIKGCPGQFAC